jgi:hypothetical protein
MKRIILSIAISMGVFTFVNAQTTPKEQVNAQTTETAAIQAANDGYKDVQIETLNEKLQTAIKENYKTFTVKNLAYNVEKKLTKVTFVTPEGTQKIVILNEDGKEVKE